MFAWYHDLGCDAFVPIDNAKARLEAVCKGDVSCAEIVAFAAWESIEFVRHILYNFFFVVVVVMVLII